MLFSILGIAQLYGQAGPNAVPDHFEICNNENTAVFDVLANDTPGCDPDLVIIGITQPVNGTSAIVSGQLVSYLPNANFFGLDSFTYTIEDGNGLQSTAIVTVSVVDDAAPFAVDDKFNVCVNSSDNIFDVLANDIDCGQTPTIITVSDPAGGSAFIIGGGTQVSYTPDPGFNGTDNFTYTIEDSQGRQSTATVCVNVGLDVGPTAVCDEFTICTNSTNNVLDVMANDTFGCSTTIIISCTTQPINGTVTIVPGGTAIIYSPNIAFTGSDSFTYKITDTNGNTSTAVVMVTISNIAGPNAVDNFFEICVNDCDHILDVLANDVSGCNQNLSIVSVTEPTSGTAQASVLQGNQFINYEPNGFIGLDSFMYTMQDGNGNMDTATVIINSSTTAGPTAAQDRYEVCINSQATLLKVLENDIDGCNSPIKVVAKTDGLNGTVSILGAQTEVVYTPNAAFTGFDFFSYTIEDAVGKQSSTTVIVNVSATAGPTAQLDIVSICVDSSLNVINVLANDIAGCDPNLEITAVSAAVSGTALVTIEAGGAAVGYDPNGHAGDDSFTYTIIDGNGNTSTTTVFITVS